MEFGISPMPPPMPPRSSTEEPLPDLSLCDQEPIHIPGSIQPRGVLMALQGAGLCITQVSQSSLSLLGSPPAELLGQPLQVVLGADLAQQVRAASQRWLASPQCSACFVWLRSGTEDAFSGYVHRQGDILVLELEPQPADDQTAAPGWLDDALARFAALRAQRELDAKLTAAVTLFRELTGYDRVMIYRFDAEWHGEVVAESRRADIESYLGLHYPASDIPVQARRLYIISPTRIIVDIEDEASPLVPLRDPQTGAMLDLSLSLLRSVSPVHLEYLRNMGVRATLTASLVCDGTLWGLIACHHLTPRVIPRRFREVIGWMAQDLATQVALVEEISARRYREQLKALRERVLVAMRSNRRLAALLSGTYLPAILGAVGADGVALIQGGEIITAGVAPDPERIRDVVDRLSADEGLQTPADLFVTECLSEQLDGTADLAETAAGLLIQPLAGEPPMTLAWFRGEQLHDVSWGGDPSKTATMSAEGRLNPRKSFAAWRQTVRARSLRWLPEELESARELSVLIDIEQRRIAEQALKVALTKYKTLFEAFPLGITVCDKDGAIIEINAMSERLLGLPAEQHLRRAIDSPEWTILRPDGSPMPAAEYASVRALRDGEEVRNQEISLISADGRQRWLGLTAAPLSIDDLGAVLVYEDITERKQMQAARQAQAALRESERRFRIMADELPLMIWVHDASISLAFVNKTCCVYFGADEERLTGQSWRELVHPDDRACYTSAFVSASRARKPFHGQCRMRRADGQWRWLESFARPMYEPDGAFAGVVGTSVDISERKAAEEALQNSHRELERRAEQLGRLTSALTLAEQRERERLAKVLHDHLQQLLVGAVLGIERVRRKLAGSSESPGVHEAITGVKDVLEAAIDSSRTLVGNLGPPVLQEGSLADALEWLARTIQANHGLTVDLSMQRDVSPRRADVRIVVFESVREALFNVVKHANCDRAQVELGPGEPGRLRLVVRDQGVGFDTGRLARGETDGTGFGILAMRERLRALGGSCEIESSPGQGTRVILTAPLDADPNDGPRDDAISGPIDST